MTTLEDKIVQRAVVEVLNAIYESDFRDSRMDSELAEGQHDAMDALAFGIQGAACELDIGRRYQGFFDSLSQEWLIKFLEHRIGDRRMIRLIQKWLRAGVLDEGEGRQCHRYDQGAVISPLLANVFLHYVFDLWADRWRRAEARGKVIIVRYADDIVLGFEHEADARQFWDAMRARL